MPTPERSPREMRILATIRDARFAMELRCVRCASNSVIQWGRTAAKRQRYRCRNCRKTFSDLTDTPAENTKLLEKWAQFTVCMLESKTLRASAKLLGVQLSTAFRWRRVILAGLTRVAKPQLTGHIEIGDHRFPYSEKGRRRHTIGAVTKPRAPYPERPRGSRVYVLFACDRFGTVVSGKVAGESVTLVELDVLLKPRLSKQVALLSSAGPISPLGRFAGKLGIRHERVGVGTRHFNESYGRRRPHPLHHRSNMVEYRLRLLDWLPRFRGVATRYLDNYLAWYAWLDALLVSRQPLELLQWPLLGIPAPPRTLGMSMP